MGYLALPIPCTYALLLCAKVNNLSLFCLIQKMMRKILIGQSAIIVFGVFYKRKEKKSI